MPRSTRSQSSTETLNEQLSYLKLNYLLEHYDALATEAAQAQWTHVQYLACLIEGEALERQQRSIQRRIRQARFPLIKTLDAFQWTWPNKLNRAQVQNLFRLTFIDEHANIIFLGGVGLGKTHLATALGHAACLKGYTVLFTTAVDVINTLNAAQQTGQLKS